MKLEYNEREWGLELSLTPETVKETAELLRFSNNALGQKPDIFMSFSGAQPWCCITMKKRKPSKQINSINPFRK